MTHEQTINQLRRAVLLGLEMRDRQKKYWMSRTTATQIQLRQAEAAFDEVAHVALHQSLHWKNQSAVNDALLRAVHFEIRGQTSAPHKTEEIHPSNVPLDDAAIVSDVAGAGLEPNDAAANNSRQWKRKTKP